MTSAGGEVALGEQDQRVVEQVGRPRRPGPSRVAVAIRRRRSRRRRRPWPRSGPRSPPRSPCGRRRRRRRRGATSCTSRPVGRRRASAIVAHSVSSQAKPWVDALGGRAVGVEAAPRAAMAGRPGGIDRDEQRVAVAVDREVDEPQDVAARLALAPQPVARPRVEMDLAGRDGRGQRLGVHLGDHQHAAVGDVLDDGRHEPVRRRTLTSGDRRAPASCDGLPGRAGRAGRPRPSRP